MPFPSTWSIGLALAWAVAAGIPGRVPAAPVTLDFDTFSFAHNLEYTDNSANYRLGETFFGQQLSVTADYHLTETVTVTGGGFLALTFGAEQDDRWDDVEPILRFDLHPNDDFQLVFGNLSRARHTFLLALYDEVLRYQRPTQNGLELFLSRGRFRQTSWITWQQLNLPQHREKFDIGSVGRVDLEPLLLDAQLHYIHRGGQLYATGPVSDNTALALGGTLGLGFLAPGLQECGLAVHWLHSEEVPDRMKDTVETGNGVTATAFGGWRGWRLFCSYWNGEGFFAEDGHPFFRADDFLMAGFQKTWHLDRRTVINFGFTGYRLDTSYPYAMWLTVGAGSRPGLSRAPTKLY